MPIRVLIVDDSAYNRQAIQRMLEFHPEIRVVGAARDGEARRRCPPRPEVARG